MKRDQAGRPVQKMQYATDDDSLKRTILLSAAAPDLLAALQAIVNDCQPPALLAEGIKREPSRKILEMARAAIAKAEGR